MRRRHINRWFVDSVSGPEMQGLVSYLSGSRWLRDADGHGTGGGGGTDDNDDGSDADDDDSGDSDASDDADGGDNNNSDNNDDADKPRYTQAEYDRVRARMRAADKHRADALNALEKAKADSSTLDETTKKELAELKPRVEALTSENRNLRLKVAVMTTSVRGIEWEDIDAVLTMVDLSDVDIDEKGNIDKGDLTRALRELARAKPYLVRKRTKKTDTDDDGGRDNGSGDDGSSGSTMNGKRRGTGRQGLDRAALAKRFPVLKQR